MWRCSADSPGGGSEGGRRRRRDRHGDTDQRQRPGGELWPLPVPRHHRDSLRHAGQHRNVDRRLRPGEPGVGRRHRAGDDAGHVLGPDGGRQRDRAWRQPRRPGGDLRAREQLSGESRRHRHDQRRVPDEQRHLRADGQRGVGEQPGSGRADHDQERSGESVDRRVAVPAWTAPKACGPPASPIQPRWTCAATTSLARRTGPDLAVRDRQSAHERTALTGLSARTLAANNITSDTTVGQWRASVTSKIGAAASQPVLLGSPT